MSFFDLFASLALCLLTFASAGSQDKSNPTLKDQPIEQQTAVKEILRLGGDWEAGKKTVLIGFIGGNFKTDQFSLLTPLTDVRILYFHQVAADDDAFKNCTPLRQIEEIQIQSCSFTGVGFKHLRECKKLHQLLIEDTPVNDDGLKEIAKLTSLKTLRIDYLDANPKFTEAGVNKLTSLKNLKSLSLTMSVIPSGLKDTLQQELPKCKISLHLFTTNPDDGG